MVYSVAMAGLDKGDVTCHHLALHLYSVFEYFIAASSSVVLSFDRSLIHCVTGKSRKNHKHIGWVGQKIVFLGLTNRSNNK